ncbi:jg730 [Pararge aegeria aegeria]|uniref:Jg730 protein n=1 Tax=Pararge aegeria aegeria TaxID=348720 RepID=A0A8S4S713_9NEOP|nr:jg730 [Pararge aegeria aegeria]
MVAKSCVTFEEALDMTGFGKFNFLAMLVTISLITSMAFEIMSVAYLVPASACDLNTTVFQQGLMAGMPLLGLDRLRGWVLRLSLEDGKSHCVPSPCAREIKVAGTYALALTLLSECTPKNRRSILVASTSTIYLSATGVMAVLSIPVLQLSFSHHLPLLDITFVPWRLLNLIFSMPCALAAVGVYLSYESPRYLLSVGDDEKALEVLKAFFVINTGKSADEYNVGSLVLGEDTGKSVKGLWASIISQTVPLLKPPLLKNTVILSILFVIVYVGMKNADLC